MSKKRKTAIILLSVLAVCLLSLAVFYAVRASLGLLEIVEKPVGGDWRTWRGYSADYDLGNGDAVTFSPLDMEEGDLCKGFGVYDAVSGGRFANIILEPEYAEKYSKNGKMDFLTWDVDGDGTREIGVPLDDGTVLWYQIGCGYVEEGFYNCPIIKISQPGEESLPPTEEVSWRSQKNFSGDYELSEDYIVAFTPLDVQDGKLVGGYGVYDAREGNLLGTIEMAEGWASRVINPEGMSFELDDKNWDGLPDLGIELEGRELLWFNLRLEDRDEEGRFPLIG